MALPKIAAIMKDSNEDLWNWTESRRNRNQPTTILNKEGSWHNRHKGFPFLSKASFTTRPFTVILALDTKLIVEESPRLIPLRPKA